MRALQGARGLGHRPDGSAVISSVCISKSPSRGYYVGPIVYWYERGRIKPAVGFSQWPVYEDLKVIKFQLHAKLVKIIGMIFPKASRGGSSTPLHT